MTKPSYTHLMSDSITQNPAQTMNELDAIAEEAARKVWCWPEPPTDLEVAIRAAIDKAIEVVLTKEPSEGQCRALYEAQAKIASQLHKIEFAPFETVASKNGQAGLEGLKEPIRAVAAQRLEELGNSSGTRAGNHPSAIDETR